MGKHTTLVVGAGAGVEYSLPTGYDLFKRIWKGPLDSHLEDELSDIERSICLESLRNMCRAASQSGQSSIDSFLERRSEFESEGKIQIAAHLLPLEWTAIYNGLNTRGWIAWLFRALESNKSLRNDTVSIVTFNYDRLVECGLSIALANSHNLDFDTATREVSRIPLIHVYGLLNAPVSPREIGRFKGKPNAYWISNAAKGIKIISEDRASHENATLDLARAEVWRADQLVFLGFGFDSTNLDRIGASECYPKWRSRHRPVHATAYDLSDRVKNKTREILGQGINWGSPKESIEHFLDENIDLS